MLRHMDAEEIVITQLVYGAGLCEEHEQHAGHERRHPLSAGPCGFRMNQASTQRASVKWVHC
ncbi:MAG: hypothetical protein QF579_05065 [Dehalococcoidia bacterium]|nr:hypothetical protein [Dehalococcoidia bacterium]